VSHSIGADEMDVKTFDVGNRAGYAMLSKNADPHEV
jgi:hypothetical protein